MPQPNELCFGGTVYRSSKDKLPSFVRDQFTAYFMARYPQTRKIRLSSDAGRRYTARAKFADRRTFIVRAFTLEKLCLYMQSAYDARFGQC